MAKKSFIITLNHSGSPDVCLPAADLNSDIQKYEQAGNLIPSWYLLCVYTVAVQSPSICEQRNDYVNKICLLTTIILSYAL